MICSNPSIPMSHNIGPISTTFETSDHIRSERHKLVEMNQGRERKERKSDDDDNDDVDDALEAFDWQDTSIQVWKQLCASQVMKCVTSQPRLAPEAPKERRGGLQRVMRGLVRRRRRSRGKRWRLRRKWWENNMWKMQEKLDTKKFAVITCD